MGGFALAARSARVSACCRTKWTRISYDLRIAFRIWLRVALARQKTRRVFSSARARECVAEHLPKPRRVEGAGGQDRHAESEQVGPACALARAACRSRRWRLLLVLPGGRGAGRAPPVLGLA